MKSAFGSSFKPFDPFPATPKPPHHGILHNLLTDAIDSAKGIPFGVIQTVEHPLKSVKLIGQSYADTYGHGFGHFKNVFMAHPLQPLLDAISIPLMAAAGAGAAVKGVSVAAELGRTAEAADMIAQSSKLAAAGKFAEADSLRAQAMRHPKLDAAAQRFRKGTSASTRMVPVQSLGGAVSLPKAYSSNIFRRGLTKGSEFVLEGVTKKGDVALGERLLAKEMSKRAAATAAASKGQAAVLVGAKNLGLDPNEVINHLGDRLEHSLQQNALLVDASRAEELAANPTFKSEFQFIYEKPAQKGFIEPKSGFTVDASGQATRTPHVAHPPQAAATATRPLSMGGYEHEQMMAAIKTLGKRVETGTNAKRARVVDGKVMIVRSKLAETMIRDMEGTARLGNYIYRNVLGAWKGFILGLSPRYFVNNVMGNVGMYAAATNPVEFTRGMLESVKAVKGIRAAAKVEKGAERTVDDLMRKWMPDEWVHSRFGYLQHGALGVEQTAGVRLKGALKRAGHAKLYAVTEQIAYRGPQRSSLMGALHTDGDFRNLYRRNLEKGMERGKAYRDAADTIISDPRKSAAFEKRVTDWAGQYYHLNSLEKKITAFVPFYTWDRHALRFGKEQVLSRPVSSIVLAQLGALGDKEADRELGKIPDFMKGAIPVSGHGSGILGLLLGQNIAGRKKILLTSGYNPLAAAADDADAIAAMFGQGPRSPSESIGGQLNPVIAGAISGITGQTLFSGAKADTHGLGPVGGIYEEAFGQLPHKKLIELSLGKKPPTTTKRGTPTLYDKGMRQVLSSIMGLNERDFSPAAARRLSDEQTGTKRGRRRKARKDVSSLKSQLKSNF
jgi:hypothetical protein